MAKRKQSGDARVLETSPTHLLHRVLQMALDYHTEAAGTDGLTQRQYALLAATAGQAGLTQSDLVRATSIDRSTLAELVARMETRGLITRERSAQDSRANAVHLTDLGQAALTAGAVPAAAADERLLEKLPAKKRAGFVKLLGVLAAGEDERSDGKPAKSAKLTSKKAKKKKSKKGAKAAPDPESEQP